MSIRTTGKKSATVVTVLLALGSFAGTGAASLALWAHTPAGKTRVAMTTGPDAGAPAAKQAPAPAPKAKDDQDDQSPSQAAPPVQPAQPAPVQQAQPVQPAPVSQGSGGSSQSQSSGS